MSPGSTNPDLEYLKSLQAVRDRSVLVLQAANEGKLNSFTYHPDQFSSCADLVESVIRVSDRFDSF